MAGDGRARAPVNAQLHHVRSGLIGSGSLAAAQIEAGVTSIGMAAKIETYKGGSRPVPTTEVRVKASEASLALAKRTRRGVMTYVSLIVRRLLGISSGKGELLGELSVFPRGS